MLRSLSFILIVFLVSAIEVDCDGIINRTECVEAKEICWWDSRKEAIGHACNKFSGRCSSINTIIPSDCISAGRGNKCFYERDRCFDNCSSMNADTTDCAKAHPYCDSSCRGCERFNANAADCDSSEVCRYNGSCGLGCASIYDTPNPCNSDPSCYWKDTLCANFFNDCSKITSLTHCQSLSVCVYSSACVNGCSLLTTQTNCINSASVSCYWDSLASRCYRLNYCESVNSEGDCTSAGNGSLNCTWINNVGCVPKCEDISSSSECRSNNYCWYNSSSKKCNTFTGCAGLQGKSACNEESSERCYWSGSCVDFSSCGNMNKQECDIIPLRCKWNTTSCVDVCPRILNFADCLSRPDCYDWENPSVWDYDLGAQKHICRDKLDEGRCSVEGLNSSTCSDWTQHCKWDVENERCEFYGECKTRGEWDCHRDSWGNTDYECWYDYENRDCRPFTGLCGDIGLGHADSCNKRGVCYWNGGETRGRCETRHDDCDSSTSTSCTAAKCWFDDRDQVDNEYHYSVCTPFTGKCGDIMVEESCREKDKCWWKGGACQFKDVCAQITSDYGCRNERTGCWWDSTETSDYKCKTYTGRCTEITNNVSYYACAYSGRCVWAGVDGSQTQGTCNPVYSSTDCAGIGVANCDNNWNCKLNTAGTQCEDYLGTCASIANEGSCPNHPHCRRNSAGTACEVKDLCDEYYGTNDYGCNRDGNCKWDGSKCVPFTGDCAALTTDSQTICTDHVRGCYWNSSATPKCNSGGLCALYDNSDTQCADNPNCFWDTALTPARCRPGTTLCGDIKRPSDCNNRRTCWWDQGGTVSVCRPFGYCGAYGTQGGCLDNEDCWWNGNTGGISRCELFGGNCGVVLNSYSCNKRKTCWWDDTPDTPICRSFTGNCEDIVWKTTNAACLEKNGSLCHVESSTSKCRSIRQCSELKVSECESVESCYRDGGNCRTFEGCPASRYYGCPASRNCTYDDGGRCVDKIDLPSVDENGKGCSSYITKDSCRSDVYVQTPVGKGCVWNSGWNSGAGECQNYSGCSNIESEDFGGDFLNTKDDCKLKGCVWRSVGFSEGSSSCVSEIGYCENDANRCETHEDSVACGQNTQCLWYGGECIRRTCANLPSQYCTTNSSCEVVGGRCIFACSLLGFDQCVINENCHWSGNTCQNTLGITCADVERYDDCTKFGCDWVGLDAVNIKVGKCASWEDFYNLKIRNCDDYRNGQQCDQNTTCKFLWNAAHDGGQCINKTSSSAALGKCGTYKNREQCIENTGTPRRCGYYSPTECPYNDQLKCAVISGTCTSVDSSFLYESGGCFWKTDAADGQHCREFYRCESLSGEDCGNTVDCAVYNGTEGCVRKCEVRSGDCEGYYNTCVRFSPANRLGQTCVFNCWMYSQDERECNAHSECHYNTTVSPYTSSGYNNNSCQHVASKKVDTLPIDLGLLDCSLVYNSTNCNWNTLACGLGCVWNTNDFTLNSVLKKYGGTCKRFRSCSDIKYPAFHNAERDCNAKSSCYWNNGGCGTTPPDKKSKSKLSAGGIAGIIIGAVVFVILVVLVILLILFLLSRRKKGVSNDNDRESDDTSKLTGSGSESSVSIEAEETMKTDAAPAVPDGSGGEERGGEDSGGDAGAVVSDTE